MPAWNKLTANATVTGDSTRIEVFEGRDHLVAPCVAIVAGVLNGVFISADEISIFTEAWNGIPLTINHPMEGAIPVSANRPDIIETQSIGRFWNATFENNSLKGELWIDIQKARDLGGEAVEILDRLENGGNLEVSTGFWAEHSNQSGSFQGKRFFATAHNIRPDHLALLPNDIGACNWADGCGAPRINHAHLGCEECSIDHPCEACQTEEDDVESREIVKQMKQLLLGNNARPDEIYPKPDFARTPIYESISFHKWIDPTFSDFTAAFDSKAESFETASLHLKRFIAGHSLLGDPKSYDFKNGSRLVVVDPKTGELNVNALRGVAELDTSSVDFDGVPESLRKSAQEKAKSLLEKIGEEFSMNITINRTDKDIRIALEGELARREGFDFSFTFILAIDLDEMTFVFFQGDRLMQQSFEIGTDGIIRITGDPVDVQGNTTFIPVPDDSGGGMDTNKETEVTKDEKINLLIANSSEWTESDRGVLQVTSDGMIDKLYGLLLNQADQQNSSAAVGNAGPSNTQGVASHAPASAALDANAAPTEWSVDQVPAEYRQAVLDAMKSRGDLIDRLVANQNCPFTEEQLKLMSAEQLQKLEEAFAPQSQPQNFELRGMPPNPVVNADGHQDGRRPPPPSTRPQSSQAASA